VPIAIIAEVIQYGRSVLVVELLTGGFLAIQHPQGVGLEPVKAVITEVGAHRFQRVG
jgi:hypothetical protein